jgi:hypothetical protein
MLSTPAKVGIITLIGLALLAAVTVWKSEIILTRQGYKLTVSFENIEGLTVGSEVRFRGAKIGKIRNIDPGPYDIKVYAVIEPGIHIPADSYLRVAYDGIVGMKFLEIKPGTSESLYTSSMQLKGISTAAIVDFIDIGSKNLVETKAILENVRKIIENPELQNAFKNGVFTFEKVAEEAEKLVHELRATTQGIGKITTDPKFQDNVKGTVQETEKTLASANRFFEGMGRLDVRTSGGVDLGTRANAVRGDVDVIQSDRNYLRFGIGEGPTRQMSVLDFLFSSKVSKDYGYRLGVINNQLGGGIAFYPWEKGLIRGDIYDINNPRPNWPKVRLGYQYELREFMDLALQADDVLNSGNSNFMVGIRVKPLGSKLD